MKYLNLKSTFAFLLFIALFFTHLPVYSQIRQDGKGVGVGAGKVTELPAKEKRWALIIGVDDYRDENISDLSGAANDAETLAESLEKSAGFPKDQIIVLSTKKSAQRQPTRANVLRYLSNLKSLVKEDGLLLVSFSGHGIERGGKAFLIPSDAISTDDIFLLENTAVEVENLKQQIKRTNVKQVLFLIDACRNDPTSGRSDSENPLTEAYTRGFSFDTRNKEVEAFATIYATSVGSRAYEYAEKRQGYFTWAIVEALSGQAANADGEITLGGLVRYISERVPKMVAINLGSGKKQKPFAYIEGYKADELIIAFNPRNSQSVRPTQANTNPNVEEIYWEEVSRQNAVDGYQDYLKEFPNGRYTALARLRLKDLQKREKNRNSSADNSNREKEAEIYFNLGRNCKSNDFSCQISNFSKAINLDPNYSLAYIYRGNIYNNIRNYDQAIMDYTKAIEIEPNDSLTYFNRGTTYLNIKSYDQAFQDYTKALEINPNYYDAYNGRGAIFENTGKYDQAIRDFTKAIELKPDFAEAYSNRGIAYSKKKDYDRAIEDLTKAIELNPKLANAYNGRGSIFENTGKYDQAIRDFTKAIELKPDFAEAYSNRGIAYYKKQNYDLAIRDHTKAIDLNPNSVEYYRNRADSYNKIGEIAKAQADRKKAEELEKQQK